MGIKKRNQDFGLTLARWGDTNSPYLVLPFLGPSTVRDGFAWLYDYSLFTLYPYIEPDGLRYAVLGYVYILRRSELLESEKLINQAGIDPYLLIRDAYLQRRAYLIADNQGFSVDASGYIEGDEDEEEFGPE